MLVRTPPPFETESLFGYVLRISETNGYDSPWHVLNHAGLSQQEMNSPAIPTEKLSAVLGASPSALEHIAYTGINPEGLREYSLISHSLGRSMAYAPLRLTQPSFCPHCVAKQGYIDAFWDLSIAVACPIHRCTPVTHCPSCSERLTRFRPGLLTCKCGASLAKAMTDSAEPALADLMAVLWAKLHRHPIADMVTPSGMPAAELMGMSLRSLLLKLPELGRFDLNSRGQDGELSSLVGGAAQMLVDWPRNFRSFLHRVGHASSSTGIGYRKRFEHFYGKFISNRKGNSDLGWLRDEFLRYGLEEWDLSIVDDKLLRNDQAARRFVTKSELARHLNVSVATIGNWADKGHIHLKKIQTSSKGLRYIADLAADELTAPLRSDGATWQARKAAAYLGMPVRVLAYLKEKGHLPALHISTHKHGYHQADLDRFRERLLALSPLVTVGSLMESSVELVSLEYALRNFKFHNHDRKAEFVAAYLCGEYVSVGRTGDTLADIQFEKAEVMAYVSASRVASVGGSFPQHEAAQIIGCDPMAISGLISQGFLATAQAHENSRIPRDSLEQFIAKYAALAALSNELNTTSYHLRRLCQQSGLPIFTIVTRYGSSATFIEKSSTKYLRELSSEALEKSSSRRNKRT